MCADVYYSGDATRFGACLARLVEKIDTTSWPTHPAVAVGQDSGTADAGVETVEESVEAGQGGPPLTHEAAD